MNPPYYDIKSFLHPQNDIKYKAHVEGALKLKDWIFFAHERLKNKGRLSIVHRAEALESILSLLKEHNFGGIATFPLWPKEKKLAKRIVINAVKNSKKPSRLFPGVVLHTQENTYTQEAEQILRGEKPAFWKNHFNINLNLDSITKKR